MQFKRNLLSVALASATLMLAAQAQAQDAGAQEEEAVAASDQDATELDRVVVTGIRRGIEDSIDTKQAEDTIVEAISAEDIGKLPDTSIADSIARLPGLTAQRFGGRPQEINIRGFAGDFSTTLLNGREQVSMGNNRGVEFDQYPSELMSQVVVHKTTDAELVGQGLSGTVNLKTVRPLAFGERAVAMNIRGDMNKIDDEKEYGNRYSISYIDQFADDTIGIALGYAHLSNPSQGHQFGSWGYNNDTGTLNGADIFDLTDDNERDGLMGTLEWKPNDSFHSVLDLFYSKFDKEQTKQGVQFGLSNIVPQQTSSNGTVTQATADMGPVVIRNDFNAAYDDLYALGWSNELDINEHWKLRTDISHSGGKRNERVLETYSVLRSGLTSSTTYTFNPDGYFDFDFGLDFDDPDNFALMDPGGWGGGDNRAQAGYLKDFTIKDHLTAARIDLQRVFDTGFISSLEFGGNITDRSKSRASDEYTLCVTAACDPVANVPGEIPTAFLSSTDIDFAGLGSFLTLDPNGLVNDYFHLLGKNHSDIAKKNWEVNESVRTLYVQANIDTDLGSAVTLRGNVGVQAVNVQQDSTGVQTFDGNAAGVAIYGDYGQTDYLPSTNLSFGLPADQFVRFGASRQMARPRMDEMRINDNITVNRFRDSNNDGAITQADWFWERNGGNINLEPWLANAYDISYEKYFGGNRGYVSAAYFYKDLKTYIYNQIVQFDVRDTTVPPSVYDGPNAPLDPIGEFTRPENGEGGVIKGWELAVSIPFDLLWQPLEGFGFIGSYSDTTSSISPDGPGTSTPLPGLSKYVSNMTLYFERWGFSARVSQRSRSEFLGEVQGFGGDRTRVFFDGEDVVDAQIGYTIQSGPLENLGFTFQVNNLTDEPFRRFADFSDRPNQYTNYGRTYLLGVNYRF
jgi:iron complex outermembrane receptor protein